MHLKRGISQSGGLVMSENVSVNFRLNVSKLCKRQITAERLQRVSNPGFCDSLRIILGVHFG
jgi:hypothetical protein